jgi:hypothetical protein
MKRNIRMDVFSIMSSPLKSASILIKDDLSHGAISEKAKQTVPINICSTFCKRGELTPSRALQRVLTTMEAINIVVRIMPPSTHRGEVRSSRIWWKHYLPASSLEFMKVNPRSYRGDMVLPSQMEMEENLRITPSLNNERGCNE